MGHVLRDGINRLRHARGYSEQYDRSAPAPPGPAYLAGTGLLGGPNPELMAEADCVVIWGTNAVNTQVNVMTHAMRARKQHGARIVAIDIYRTPPWIRPTCRSCCVPAPDGAFALAVMHVLLARRPCRPRLSGAADRFRTTRSRRTSRTRTPEWAAAITGLGTAEI